MAAALSGLAVGGSCVALSNGNTLVLSEGFRSYFSTGGSSPQQEAKQQITLLSDSEENKRLTENQESYTVDRNKGVLRYDISQLASNNPIEDDRSEQIVEVVLKDESGTEVPADWAFWGVYDGHSGWYTSAKLRDELISSVVKELAAIHPTGDNNKLVTCLPPSSTEVDAAIKQGFLTLDNEICVENMNKVLKLKLPKSETAQYLLPGLSGACGMLAFYNSASKTLKVAVTGDSRALLGSLNDKNQWTVESLTIDQTGSNKSEVERIRNEHPNESTAVTRGRILGRLEPSRAFGDGKFKWLREIQEYIHKNLFSYPPPSNLKTPPYVTAEPVVTTRQISPQKNDFMVLGTDGLYEMLTNEEIAGLVIRWAEKKGIVKNNGLFGGYFQNSASFPKVVDITEDKESLKPPYRENTKGPKKIVLEDENAGTHLIRNALTMGTGDKDYGKMLLSIPSPLSRRYRDDLTVVVVFFGDSGNVEVTNRLKVNLEATGIGSKPKL